jgi:hypothetical protein
LHVRQPSSCQGSPTGSPSGSASPSGSVSPDCLAHVGPLLTAIPGTNSKALKLGHQLQQQQEVLFEGTGAVTGVQQGIAAAGASPDACSNQTGAVLGPELVGFVLLDPLWDEGQEVGYVASVMRMKRSAHTGEAGWDFDCLVLSTLWHGYPGCSALGTGISSPLASCFLECSVAACCALRVQSGQHQQSAPTINPCCAVLGLSIVCRAVPPHLSPRHPEVVD